MYLFTQNEVSDVGMYENNMSEVQIPLQDKEVIISTESIKNELNHT